MAPPPLAIHILGPPAVFVAGEPAPADVLWRKHLALLTYLALSPHLTRSRAHLQTLLWPEKDTSHARHSLNEAVRRLRGGLGADRIRSRGDALALEHGSLEVDLQLASAEDGDAELLEGFTLPDAPAFDDWLRDERLRLRRRRVSARLAAGERALGAHQLAAALDAAHTALALDPAAEPAVALAMRAAALGGDRAGALRWYRDFADRLATELGTTPGRDLAGLAQRIERGAWRGTPPERTVLPPLTGRADCHRRVFDVVHESLRHGPAVLACNGGTGLGKSRLVDEVADRWRLEGGTTTVARPVEHDRAVPWSTLAELFRRGLTAAPGVPATAPDALATLAAVVPGLPVPANPNARRDVQEVATALRALLTAVAEETPLALLIDDAHWADAASLAALDAALTGITTLPLLTVVASAADGATRPELSGLVGRIGRAAPGAVVTLTPLGPDDTQAMVEALATWCPQATQRHRLARRLHFETGGNPLLLVTLLHGLSEVRSVREDALEWPPPAETLDAAVPEGVPHLAQMVILGRISQLDVESRALLVAACTDGRVVDPEVARVLADLDAAQADRALADLEHRGFLTFDGARYIFPAPLVTQVVLNGLLTRGERHRLLERRAALLERVEQGGG